MAEVEWSRLRAPELRALASRDVLREVLVAFEPAIEVALRVGHMLLQQAQIPEDGAQRPPVHGEQVRLRDDGHGAHGRTPSESAAAAEAPASAGSSGSAT